MTQEAQLIVPATVELADGRLRISLPVDLRFVRISPGGNEHVELATARLTRRERQIFDLARRGFQIKEIAQQVARSRSAVKHHLDSIYKKLGVHAISELRANYPE